jgi:hypothetical protein
MMLLDIVVALQLCVILSPEPTTVGAQEIDAQHVLGSDWGINDTSAPLSGSSSSMRHCHVAVGRYFLFNLTCLGYERLID